MPLNTIWTIGHSNRELNDFFALLAAEKIESLADVRRFPGSRRHPHFNHEALSDTLQNLGITYAHFPTHNPASLGQSACGKTGGA